MLATAPVIIFIPTRDAARSRDFYENTIGLRLFSDDQFAIVMDANGIMLRVGEFTPSPSSAGRSRTSTPPSQPLPRKASASLATPSSSNPKQASGPPPTTPPN